MAHLVAPGPMLAVNGNCGIPTSVPLPAAALPDDDFGLGTLSFGLLELMNHARSISLMVDACCCVHTQTVEASVSLAMAKCAVDCLT